jgi:anti-anti-sigma factor
VSASFRITISQDGPDAVARLTLVGDVDLACRTELRSRLRELATLPVARVEVAAARVGYVDCASLRVLDTARARAVRDGRVFEVLSVSPIFQRVATLAGYDGLVPTLPIVVPPEPGPAPVSDLLARKAGR